MNSAMISLISQRPELKDLIYKIPNRLPGRDYDSF